MSVRLAGVEYELSSELGDRPGVVHLWAIPPAPVPTLVTIGDSFTEVDGPYAWPVIVAGSAGLELVNLALGGTGYVRTGGRDPFPAQVLDGLPSSASVVVVFGGINDGAAPEPVPSVATAARLTFGMVRRLAPTAVLIVVGPQWNTATRPVPDEARARRDAVRDEAVRAGAAWIDPLAEGWFDDAATVGPDGLHPSIPLGQRVIADRVGPVVRAATTASAGAMLSATSSERAA